MGFRERHRSLFGGDGREVGNNIRFYQPDVDLLTCVVLGDISSLESRGEDEGKRCWDVLEVTCPCPCPY